MLFPTLSSGQNQRSNSHKHLRHLASRLRALCAGAGVLLLSLVSQLSAQSVTFTAFPTLGDPNSIAAGPDGALWFTESSSNKVGRVGVEGTIREYTIPTPNSNPMGITAGSDGAIWFVEFTGNKIGRITVTGEFTEYAIPTPLSGPIGIAADADGTLWFTENTGAISNIGRITLAGAIMEYSTPTLRSSPYGITAGTDGAMWFVESGGHKIGRITTGGVITEYPLPSTLLNSSHITSGPDGALWLTSGGNIGRITTNGIFSSYAINRTSGASAGGIATGPDGALWFTEQSAKNGANKLGRINSTGTIGEYPLPENTILEGGVTLGPDNAIWFAAVGIGGYKIGRAALTFPIPIVSTVRNSADQFLQTIQANSWVTVYGSNLIPANPARIWGPEDFVGGKLPVSLDGVGVTINGKSAAVAYTSSTQLNVLAPSDVATGLVNVIVRNGSAFSAAFPVQLQTFSPAFFTLAQPNQRYIAGSVVLGPNAREYLAPSGSLSFGTPSRAATAGDTIELYGTGFGPTTPPSPDGQVFFDAYATTTPVNITIGGLNAKVTWAGLSSVGLYQLNIIVPTGLAIGDALVVAAVGGVTSRTDGIFIPIR
jgi:virginiamycin B lyase